MSFGSYYVSNKFQEKEVYSEVAAYAANATDVDISSGASIVRGIYYMWGDNGFTGKGWMYKVSGGPTNLYPDFQSDEDVASYVAVNGNLNAVFQYWSKNYTLEGWDNFYNAVGIDSGCMDVDHTEQ